MAQNGPGHKESHPVNKTGDKVAITGFVSFERVNRAARTARNPQTGAEIKVPAKKAPKVSAGASFKKAVSG